MSVRQFMDDGETNNWLLEWNTDIDLRVVKDAVIAALDKKIAEIEKKETDLFRFSVLERSSGSIFTKRFMGTEAECLAFQLPPEAFGGFITNADGNIRHIWTKGNKCWTPEYGYSIIDGRLVWNIQLWMA